MTADAGFAPPAAERRPRAELEARQLERLHDLLRRIDGRNRFYTRKLAAGDVKIDAVTSLGDLSRLPLTTKTELVADQAEHPPWGTALTDPIESYTRYNQTSATTGRPLRWLDTRESWQWTIDCWKSIFHAARVGAADRVFFPFSFGPFLGFWVAFEAATQIGAHAVPAGGMSTAARLALIDTVRPTVICCTPTYALRMLEVAAETETGTAASESDVRVLIVAGEPGGSIAPTRERIERGWKARVIDHHGLTEVGPVSYECWEAPGFVHLNECEYICEVLDPASGRPVPDGERGELVVTNLGRHASPVIRYRTGDLVVRRTERCVCGRTLARIEGGILARVDDMVTVRGVNVYPTAVESILRALPEVVEYRATLDSGEALRAISIEVEIAPATADPDHVARLAAAKLREGIGLTMPVTVVAHDTLPRFEMKAKRFVVTETEDR